MTKDRYEFTPIIGRGVVGFTSIAQTYSTFYTTKFLSLTQNEFIICLCYDFTLGKRSFSFVPNLAKRIKGDSFFKGSLFDSSFKDASASYIVNNVIYSDNDILYDGTINDSQNNFYGIVKNELAKRNTYLNENLGNLIYTPSYEFIIYHLKEMEKLGNLYAISTSNTNNSLSYNDLVIKYHIYYLNQIPTYIEFNYKHTKDSY